jgi:PEGA domain-containing protein
MHNPPNDTNEYRANVVRGTRISTKFLALFLSTSLLAYAQGNTFTRVRYNGGSVASKVDPKDWNNKLTVTPDAIAMDFKDGQKIAIPPKSVTSLSYGQEAHRRVGTMVALAILVAPVALFGLFHKTRLHYIGIQYNTPDSKNAGILLQGDKDNYRAILVALQGVTGAPVSVGEKDREFIPVGLTTSVAKDSQGSATSSASAEAIGTVGLTSTPDGADVFVDGQFYGNTPATLKLKPGKHTIGVKMSGYKDWSREISTESGGEAHLTAALEKTN